MVVCWIRDPPQGLRSVWPVSLGGGQTFVLVADVVLVLLPVSPAGAVSMTTLLLPVETDPPVHG